MELGLSKGKVGIRMVIEREGFWERKSFLSLIMEIRWLMFSIGYIIIVFIDGR